MSKGKKELESDAHEFYERILHTANQFLLAAKTFEINVLQDFNPSFEELAKIMEVIADAVNAVMIDDNPLLAQKAIEYAYIMQKMALAIRNDDEISLSKLTEELDKKPFV